MIPTDEIAVQSAHVFSEDADAEVMTVLERHFGEQTEMGLSIDASRAVLSLSRCLVHMLSSFDTDNADELLDTLKAATKKTREQALIEFARTGRA